MTLKVCVDGFNLSLRQGSGIATYGRSLLTALESMGAETQVLYGPLSPVGRDTLLDEVQIAAGEMRGRKPAAWERWIATFYSRFGRTAFAIPTTGRISWPAETPLLPGTGGAWASRDLFYAATRAFTKYGDATPVHFRPSLGMERPDVCHWTVPVPLYAKRAANIVTIHDLIPLTLPFSTRDHKANFLEMAKWAARKADHIAVVSDATRRVVIDLLGVDEDRVTTTWQSVSIDPALMARPDEAMANELDAAFGLEWKSYFLHYGAVEPKKNLGRIVEAYVASGCTSPLVIAGGSGWLQEPERALLDQISSIGGSAGPRIHQLGYVSARTLTNLVRGARATVFPSLEEGFGLPALESMTLGTAVLTDNMGALGEVTGEAALGVDPWSVDSISAGLIALEADDDLRHRLETLGRERAAFFTPDRYRMRMSDLYAKLGFTT